MAPYGIARMGERRGHREAAGMSERKRKPRSREKSDVDCASCRSLARCWTEPTPLDGMKVRRYQPLERGDVLFRQGETFEAPFVLTSGCIALREILEDGTERIVAFRTPGELIGLEAWANGTYPFTAEAMAPSTVCRLRWSSAGFTDRPAPVLRHLLVKTVNLLDRSTRPWAGLPAMERVRAFVEDFLERSDQPIPMTRAQIGMHLGLAEETVVRALAKMREIAPGDRPRSRRRP
jgi:CRP/FNR family transcriptional regulator, anaerobic regulatory protein